ncbi:hypothetical protein QVD17_21225 [Tagetes erecta]|uniref:Uncharacterized protein n=1 Tax=Tagetes erecta TaxID=13708 RepID=A0AAD8KMN2_TARER|nr:hypothetical protein QVD17_21225 [Tagetes erecta]
MHMHTLKLTGGNIIFLFIPKPWDTHTKTNTLPVEEKCFNSTSCRQNSIQFRRICSRSSKRFIVFSATFSFSSVSTNLHDQFRKYCLRR